MNLYKIIRKKVFKQRLLKNSLPVIKDYECIQGYLAPLEASMLYHIAQGLPEGAVALEIGSWKGKSSYCIAKGLRNGILYCVDPFDSTGDPDSSITYQVDQGESPLLFQFQNNLNRLGVLEKIKILQGYSTDFVGKHPSLDFLFIDGDHSIEGCSFDFENYAYSVKTGGYIAFHDYNPIRKDNGPTWVIDNVVLRSDKFKQIDYYASLWVGKKIK